MGVRLFWKSDSGGAPLRLLGEERKAELVLHGPSQEPAHTVLLPTSQRLQLFYRRTFGAAEQGKADLLLRLFLDRRLGSGVSANGTFPTRLPVRPSLFSFSDSRLVGAGP